MTGTNRRLFFALSIAHDQPDTEAYIRLQTEKNNIEYGIPVPDENLHITLFFLGNTSLEQEQQLIKQIDTKTLPSAIELTCQTLHYWSRSKIIWLACDEPLPQALTDLNGQLHNIADHLALNLPSKPYLPHITLSKRAVQSSEIKHLALPLVFKFTHFGLYISEQQASNNNLVQYRCLKRWPLKLES